MQQLMDALAAYDADKDEQDRSLLLRLLAEKLIARGEHETAFDMLDLCERLK